MEDKITTRLKTIFIINPVEEALLGKVKIKKGATDIVDIRYKEDMNITGIDIFTILTEGLYDKDMEFMVIIVGVEAYQINDGEWQFPDINTIIVDHKDKVNFIIKGTLYHKPPHTSSFYKITSLKELHNLPPVEV